MQDPSANGANISTTPLSKTMLELPTIEELERHVQATRREFELGRAEDAAAAEEGSVE